MEAESNQLDKEVDVTTRRPRGGVRRISLVTHVRGEDGRAAALSHVDLNLPHLIQQQRLREIVESAFTLIDDLAEIAYSFNDSDYLKFVTAMKLSEKLSSEAQQSTVETYQAQPTDYNLATDASLKRREIVTFLQTLEAGIQASKDLDGFFKEANSQLQEIESRVEELKDIWLGYLLVKVIEIKVTVESIVDDARKATDGIVVMPDEKADALMLHDPVGTYKLFSSLFLRENPNTAARKYEAVLKYSDIYRYGVLPQLEAQLESFKSNDDPQIMIEALETLEKIRFSRVLFDLIKERVGKAYDHYINKKTFLNRFEKSSNEPDLVKAKKELAEAEYNLQEKMNTASNEFEQIRVLIAEAPNNVAWKEDAATLVLTHIVPWDNTWKLLEHILPDRKNLGSQIKELIEDGADLSQIRQAIEAIFKIEPTDTEQTFQPQVVTEPPHRGISGFVKATILAAGIAVGAVLAPHLQTKPKKPDTVPEKTALGLAPLSSIYFSDFSALAEPKVLTALKYAEEQEGLRKARIRATNESTFSIPSGSTATDPNQP